jgi:hypothetical protein
MARDINPFGLRMPQELRRRIERSAKTNRRSMNAELILRLQDSVEKDPLFVPEIKEAAKNYELTEDQSALLKAYNGLSPRRRRALLEFLVAFGEGHK